MKKIILNLILVFVCISSLQAQLLWKISGKGLKHPSYLFGTHHIIPIQFLDSVPGLYKAFNSCKTVVGEMVLNNIDFTTKIQQAAIMPNHIKMRNLLSEEEIKLINIELKSVLKMSLKELSGMNPSLINTLYTLEIYKKIKGYNPETSSDSYFQLVATEKGKKVIGLETIDQQIKLLYGNTSLVRQADILVETIRQKDRILDKMLKMEELYKSGKIEELHLFMKQKEDKTDLNDEEYAILIDDRNENWISILPTLINESACFIAVGAGHLGGEKGLIKLLEKQGYKVKAITTNP